MIFESVLPSFDFNFGGILFTKNSNGDPKESTCAPGLKGFEVQIEDQQHQLRILTSPDLQDQDQFIETIGDIICQNLSGRVYPDFIDYGVEHGLTYYLAELDGYTPLLESNYSKQDTVDYLTQFISKLEKVSYFDPEKDRIYLESLWVNASGDIVISDVVLQDGIDSNKRENINSIIDCYLQISDCEKIETTSISKPQTISALKDWLTDQTKTPIKTKTPLLEKIKIDTKQPLWQGSEKVNTKPKSKLISHPSAFTYETAYGGKRSKKRFWVIATVCLLLLVGYLLPIESIGFSKTFAKIPKIKLPFSFSNEDEGAVQRAEGYQQPQISLREEIAFYVDHATSARAGNQLMDSLYYESEALKLSHEKKVILDRINSDLNSLYQNGSITYGKDGLAFLYELAAHNPRANDIIVRHFQNVGN